MAKKTSREDLLAEVVGVGSGVSSESAIESSQGRKASRTPPAARGVGRPAQEASVQFTLRLRPTSAQLLQSLVSDLQGRAIRGEIARSEATIGLIVEQALELYAKKHQHGKQG